MGFGLYTGIDFLSLALLSLFGFLVGFVFCYLLIAVCDKSASQKKRPIVIRYIETTTESTTLTLEQNRTPDYETDSDMKPSDHENKANLLLTSPITSQQKIKPKVDNKTSNDQREKKSLPLSRTLTEKKNRGSCFLNGPPSQTPPRVSANPVKQGVKITNGIKTNGTKIGERLKKSFEDRNQKHREDKNKTAHGGRESMKEEKKRCEVCEGIRLEIQIRLWNGNAEKAKGNEDSE